MKTFRVLVTTALFVLVPALAAYAATIFTPTLVASGGEILCVITNVGDSTETVTIEPIDPNTGLPFNPFTVSLPPGVGRSAGVVATATVAAAFCKFTVPDKLTTNFRTAILILNPITSTVTVALPGF